MTAASELTGPSQNVPSGDAIAAAMPAAGDAAVTRRVAAYEQRLLLEELAVLEARRPVVTSLLPPNLRDRPHILAMIESRAGGRTISAAQHLIWAVRKRWRDWRGVATPPMPAAVTKPVAAPARLHGDRPRLLIDITPTALANGVRGGIPRVVRELSRAGLGTGLALPVRMRDGRLISGGDETGGAEVVVRPGDVYLIADIFWYYLAAYQEAAARVRAAGGRVALVVYDLFPIQYPAFFPEEVGRVYEAGLRALLAQSSDCLGISSSVRDGLAAYLATLDLPGAAGIRLGWFGLGVTPEPPGEAAPVRDAVAALFAAPPVFLSVGTLEPRKGYAVTLDACELAWRRGADFHLVIIGRYGWRSEALRGRILNHAEYGQRLFWLQDAHDAELELAYRRCHCLIQSSIAEGFGLPIAEAAFHATPVIASDLPVFREVGGEALAYTPVADAEALANRMQAALRSRPAPPRAAVRGWDEVVRELDRLLFPPAGQAAASTDVNPTLDVVA